MDRKKKRQQSAFYRKPLQALRESGCSPLLEVAEANLVETVCADSNDTAKDGETREVLAWQVALVSDRLVASGRRKFPVRQKASSGRSSVRTRLFLQPYRDSRTLPRQQTCLDTHCRKGTDVRKPIESLESRCRYRAMMNNERDYVEMGEWKSIPIRYEQPLPD